MRVQGDDGTMDRGRVRHYGVVHARRLADYAAPRKRRIRPVAPLWAAPLWVTPLSAALLWVAPLWAAAAAPEASGTWIASCPPGAESACALRYHEHLFSKAGITVDLEIRAAGAAHVPVIVVHGLPQQPALAAAVAARIDATMRLDQGPSARLTCAGAGDSYLCQPDGDGRDTLSRGLSGATRMTIAVAADLPGQRPLTLGQRTLPMSGTAQALRRTPSLAALPADAAPAERAAVVPPGWTRLADRALRAMGLANGTADLTALLASLLRR